MSREGNPAHTILAATGVYFSVRAVANTVHGTMVALVHLGLLAAVEVVHTDPRVCRGTDNEAVAVDRVERCRGDGVWKRY